MQRVREASVEVDGDVVGRIGRGFLVLLGINSADTDETAAKLASKVAGLRLFEDVDGKMNLGLAQVGGSVLCISQFTLYGDVRRGRRPSFDAAAGPELAKPLYERFCAALESEGLRCERGRFGAHMLVSLVNEGPVTLLVDSESFAAPRRA